MKTNWGNSSYQIGRKPKGTELIWRSVLNPILKNNSNEPQENNYNQNMQSLGVDQISFPPPITKTEDGTVT